VEKVCLEFDIPGVFDDVYLAVLGCFGRDLLREFTMDKEVCLFVLAKQVMANSIELHLTPTLGE